MMYSKRKKNESPHTGQVHYANGEYKKPKYHFLPNP